MESRDLRFVISWSISKISTPFHQALKPGLCKAGNDRVARRTGTVRSCFNRAHNGRTPIASIPAGRAETVEIDLVPFSDEAGRCGVLVVENAPGYLEKPVA